MANQPPTARPFIRLPYFGRQPAQPPPPRPAPAARPPIVRGGFAQALRPNPPQLQPPPPPPQLRSTTPSPPPQLRSATPSPPPPSTTSMQRSPISSSPSPTTKSPMPSPTPSLPTPRDSPKSLQSSPSPVMNTRSPSPISLPPSQLQSSKGEVEHRTLTKAGQQTVVDKQVVYATPKGSPATKGLANPYKGDSNFNKDGEGVVTMAGENKGAVMELGRGGKFTENVSNGSELEEESGEEDDNGRGRFRRVPRNAYVNSNVQGVNDSILYNCSINHHDPGVHFSLSRNGGYRYSNGNGNGIKHHGNGKRH